MKACVIHGAGNLVIEDRPDPSPGPQEVVVRLGAGGICGSDLHYFGEGGVGDFRLREPMILGHEGAGEVVEVGRAVTAVDVGDRVAVNPNHPCGSCAPCQSGRRNLCRNVRFFGSAARFPHVPGLFAEYFLAHEDNCHVLPADFPYRIAACAEPLAVALHAVERAGKLLGRSVFIAGAGPIGVLLAAAARLAGANRICVTDLFDAPLAIARAMGATETINIKERPAAVPGKITNGDAFDVAFEASGHPSAVANVIELTAPGGRIVQVGMLPRGDTGAPLNRIIARELEFVGTFRFGPEYARAVNALVSGQVEVSPMLTHEFTFGDVDAAFAMAADKHRAMKVSLSPGQ